MSNSDQFNKRISQHDDTALSLQLNDVTPALPGDLTLLILDDDRPFFDAPNARNGSPRL